MGPDARSTPTDRLRWLAASDPKRARAFVVELLAGDASTLESVLRDVSKPGDGRLRQVFATVCRTQPATSEALVPWLRRWLESESDEFTKGAIAQALGQRSADAEPRTPSRPPALNDVEAYRYVTDRLCHRVRNALALPSAHMGRLEQLAAIVGDPELRRDLLDVHHGIQTGFVRIARNVEFDTGDGYLAWRNIELIAWLEENANLFAARFGPARGQVTRDQSINGLLVRATPFLLDTIFSNVWANAVQAADVAATIDFQCALDLRRSRVEILVVDAGPGFPESQVDTAFQQMFSTKAPSRGRGLLEIADAVARLQGTVRLTPDASGRLRIALSLPVESR